MADTARLGLVEGKSIHEIQLGAVEDPNSHEIRSLICFFAVSQSVNPTSPDSARRDRSSRMRSCQSGGEYSSPALDRSDQISSMIPIFSETVISFSGNVTFIGKILADFLPASRRRMHLGCPFRSHVGTVFLSFPSERPRPGAVRGVSLSPLHAPACSHPIRWFVLCGSKPFGGSSESFCLSAIPSKVLAPS
jgi:hypothetical protein